MAFEIQWGDLWGQEVCRRLPGACVCGCGCVQIPSFLSPVTLQQEPTPRLLRSQTRSLLVQYASRMNGLSRASPPQPYLGFIYLYLGDTYLWGDMCSPIGDRAPSVMPEAGMTTFFCLLLLRTSLYRNCESDLRNLAL